MAKILVKFINEANLSILFTNEEFQNFKKDTKKEKKDKLGKPTNDLTKPPLKNQY